VSGIQLGYPGKCRTAVAVREKQHLTYLAIVVAKHEVKAGPSAYLLPTHRQVARLVASWSLYLSVSVGSWTNSYVTEWRV
jgi:hypothetical protein